MGINTRAFILGFAFCLALCSCAGWSYRYYTLSLVTYDGTLLADKPEHDLPFNSCQPTAQDKAPCVIMFREEFFKLKRDFKDLATQLDACQRSK